MAKIAYNSKTFRNSTLEVIEQANTIINSYLAQGLTLTLRQLYYRFVATGRLGNSQQNYQRLGSIGNDGRLAGLIDWAAIEDRTRNVVINSHWRTPSEIIDACVSSYAIDKWAHQKFRVEVWIEKEALAGVFQPVCEELDVPLFACRGYTSQSEMHVGGMRMLKYRAQTPIVLHFGDHDPSGMDMTRDIRDRLSLFYGQEIELQRIALNRDQIDKYAPPPNPAKMSDSRFAQYVEIHGDESWELDALEPVVLADLIRTHTLAFRDEELWDEAVAIERSHVERLKEIRDSIDGSL